MSVDFTGWKTGDRGVMEVEFVFDGLRKNGLGQVLSALHTDALGQVIWFDPSDIKSITRIEPPIKVGDRVRVVNGGGQHGTVKAVDDGPCWVLWDDSVYITYPDTQLESIA